MLTPLVQNIVALRNRLRLTQTTFGERLDVEQATVSRWESGVHEPKDDQIARMAALAGVPVSTFRYGDQSVVPLITWPAAGRLAYPINLADVLEPDLPRIPVAGLSTGEYFALPIESDLMDRIAPVGSVIVVDRMDREPVANMSYIVVIDDEVTFKRFKQKPARFEPYSSNPDHETLFVDEGTRIVGRVRKVLAEL